MAEVSVIINCLNGERFLSQAISSIYNQTFPDWDVLFYDNGSNDNSIKIAKSFDKKIRIYANPIKVPLGTSRQHAVDLVKGKYISFLDVDDFWYPEKLYLQVQNLKTTNYSVCLGGIDVINEKNKLLYKIPQRHPFGHGFKEQLFQIDCPTSVTMINKEVLAKKGTRYNHLLKSSCEEDFLLSFLYPNERIAVIDESIAAYRITTNSVTSVYQQRLGYERMCSIRRLNREIPNLQKIYSFEYKDAKARAYFYKASFYMHSGEPAKAKKHLHKAAELSSVYKLISFLSIHKILWRIFFKYKPKLANTYFALINKQNYFL